MSNIARFDILRGIAEASISGTYKALGYNNTPTVPAPFNHAIRVAHFINNTDGDMYVSFDGVNDNLIVPANTFTLYDLTSDQDMNEKFRYESGTQLWVRYASVPTTGSFYVVCAYGKGE